MDSQLFTLSKIFTERLFRIPDYQRGYAWNEPQWRDFWNDIAQIEEGGSHYTGVLTLESVPPHHRSMWIDDLWIIDSKGYEPFYVVDGQQRLTTSIILLQAIVERIPAGKSINYTTVDDVRKKFIFDSKDGGHSRSYIFGYDKDNPSYEFLKTKIFREFSSSNKSEETVYTNNLENAKLFFADMMREYSLEDLESLYKRVTQSLLFNIFTISDEVDVCVAFETMNNRGKALSYLELLKNRLIYLSLKVQQDEFEKSKLRGAINDCWKAIYHNLGRNKDKPLDDDLFLGTHYTLYFSKPVEDDLEYPVEAEFDVALAGMSNNLLVNYGVPARRDHYRKLLQEIFVQKRVMKTEGEAELQLSDIYQYVSSLQVAVDHWYDIFNPSTMLPDSSASLWLDKLNRIGCRDHLSLILSVMLSVPKDADRTSIFEALERFIFVVQLLGYVAPRRLRFDREAMGLYHGKLTAKQVSVRIRDSASRLLNMTSVKAEIRNGFRSRGFYSWRMIRYFLYEYNLHLQEKSKTLRRKLHWSELVDKASDHQTVEHIYPQNARASYWQERFGTYKQRQKESIRNSLGNLVPLSQPKNSSLSNKPFPEKVDGGPESSVGFRYGCYAENEIAAETDWTPEHIRARGMKMLAFMEWRWSIQLGTDAEKLELLGLDFLGSKEGSTPSEANEPT